MKWYRTTEVVKNNLSERLVTEESIALGRKINVY